MSVFRFKRFEVTNDRSAMKVNTDGVLLGAAMTIKSSDRRLLDVGTGTGTIALMAAQRLFSSVQEDGLAGLRTETCSDVTAEGSADLKITAIDIDEVSVDEAAQNFRNSPWPDILEAGHSSLENFAEKLKQQENLSGQPMSRFDLIFSNPPYFDDSLLAPEQRRSNARHTSTGLSYRELLEFAAGWLSEGGRISMVLPAETEADLTRHARMNGLHLFRVLRVRTVPRKAPSRIIAEFSRKRCEYPEDEMLTIQNEGKYSEEYLSLTRDFYLFA